MKLETSGRNLAGGGNGSGSVAGGFDRRQGRGPEICVRQGRESFDGVSFRLCASFKPALRLATPSTNTAPNASSHILQGGRTVTCQCKRNRMTTQKKMTRHEVQGRWAARHAWWAHVLLALLCPVCWCCVSVDSQHQKADRMCAHHTRIIIGRLAFNFELI